jgi:hypothetical protein
MEQRTTWACFSKPPVKAYVDEVYTRLKRAFRMPVRADADEIVLRFQLEPDGTVRCVSLSHDLARPIGQAVVWALEKSAPFSPLPPEAACLANAPISVEFSHAGPAP